MKYINYILSLPKTIYFNFKVFPIKIARKLPILISHDVKINNIYRNCIKIDSEISTFMIKLNIDEGSKGVNIGYKKCGFLDIANSGTIVFKENATFAKGISMRIDGGELVVGKNFATNKNCFISCSKSVKIGNDVLLGWNVNVRDSDGHNIYTNVVRDRIINEDKAVEIGDNVWIASHTDILKGVEIPSGCIIGYRSCLTRSISENNCIVAGYPAKIVRKNILWER